MVKTKARFLIVKFLITLVVFGSLNLLNMTEPQKANPTSIDEQTSTNVRFKIENKAKERKPDQLINPPVLTMLLPRRLNLSQQL